MSMKWVTVRVGLHNEQDVEISDYEAHTAVKLALFDAELEMSDGSKWGVTHCELDD